jgi:hypothetical protein
MTTPIWQEVQDELRQGITEKEHPFRYFTLGTVGLEKLPRLRTVVLRGISEDLTLTFYTDKRSKKIIHITENNRVSLLFYHPKKLTQIKIEGLAHTVKDEATLERHWTDIQPQSRKDYTTQFAPGSELSNPDNVEYLNEENHFCMVKIVPFKIEYLRLQRPNHLRVQFAKEAQTWSGTFLVP